ncbi:MAG: cytidine deaminase [Haloferacaceae archaeon]
MDDAELLARARDAFPNAYAPYSEYPVGAALLAADGTVYVGCNVENADYSDSLHAERVALGSAVADGRREFDRIAVASAARDGVTPCGACRQVLSEFCDDAFVVLCDRADGHDAYTLGDLLPAAMGPETLGIEADR